jgi:Glycosyl transferase family 90
MRPRRIISLLGLICIVGITVLFLKRSIHLTDLTLSSPLGQGTDAPESPVSTQSHPINRLMTQAETAFKNVQARQSTSLKDTVAEYRRRYRAPPPPNFDKWYKYAKKRGVQMIDEYDTIYHSLLPFWALDPAVLRERTREAIGFDNAMIAVTIRDGKIMKIEGGGDDAEWHRNATRDMLKDFVQYLPDMDLAFNVHDEPRVVLQHDDLNRYVQTAKNVSIPLAYNNAQLSNKWSSRPADLGNGTRIKEYKTTRFNRFPHQHTWTSSRLSCSPDSAARHLSELAEDDYAVYATSPLGFVENTTAFSDICNTPSLQRSFGFFDRPNAFDITHDLFPIFSQSKISSFQDIIYPSPWYWAGRVVYDHWKDYGWSRKNNTLYWRGTTTGGFSRNGGWRRQHRQQFVQKVNALNKAWRLEHNGKPDSEGAWVQKEISRQDMKDKFDVHFTGVGQCDPGDCAAQREYFDLAPPVDMNNAFKYKYLLDIDGNAFSGRYYAFLLSKSLVYKLAIFREWHDEWLKAWVHYIPLSWKGNEYVESVRYFDDEEIGKGQAKAVADQGREWAGKVLRNEDLEAWFFRLLLEYGRLVDDDRYKIGYSL